MGRWGHLTGTEGLMKDPLNSIMGKVESSIFEASLILGTKSHKAFASAFSISFSNLSIVHPQTLWKCNTKQLEYPFEEKENQNNWSKLENNLTNNRLKFTFSTRQYGLTCRLGITCFQIPSNRSRVITCWENVVELSTPVTVQEYMTCVSIRELPGANVWYKPYFIHSFHHPCHLFKLLVQKHIWLKDSDEWSQHTPIFPKNANGVQHSQPTSRLTSVWDTNTCPF